jgi:hypothetical protein
MKVKLELAKSGALLHGGIYEIDDAQSFGAACADVWAKVRERCLTKATSIGDLMDRMHESVLDELDGAKLTVRKL